MNAPTAKPGFRQSRETAVYSVPMVRSNAHPNKHNVDAFAVGDGGEPPTHRFSVRYSGCNSGIDKKLLTSQSLWLILINQSARWRIERKIAWVGGEIWVGGGKFCRPGPQAIFLVLSIPAHLHTFSTNFGTMTRSWNAVFSKKPWIHPDFPSKPRQMNRIMIAWSLWRPFKPVSTIRYGRNQWVKYGFTKESKGMVTANHAGKIS
jgi:hypothetical protein